MDKDTKIPLAAKNFVERFGKDAPAEAKKRADELMKAGNASGYATWMEIYAHVKVMVDGKDKTVH
ncbi:MAG TPA: hypothetical protein VGA19_01170 [Rhodospirillales bacterium]|jgi:hypothetical protein